MKEILSICCQVGKRPISIRNAWIKKNNKKNVRLCWLSFKQMYLNLNNPGPLFSSNSKIHTILTMKWHPIPIMAIAKIYCTEMMKVYVTGNGLRFVIFRYFSIQVLVGNNFFNFKSHRALKIPFNPSLNLNIYNSFHLGVRN